MASAYDTCGLSGRAGDSTRASGFLKGEKPIISWFYCSRSSLLILCSWDISSCCDSLLPVLFSPAFSAFSICFSFMVSCSWLRRVNSSMFLKFSEQLDCALDRRYSRGVWQLLLVLQFSVFAVDLFEKQESRCWGPFTSIAFSLSQFSTLIVMVCSSSRLSFDYLDLGRI